MYLNNNVSLDVITGAMAASLGGAVWAGVFVVRGFRLLLQSPMPQPGAWMDYILGPVGALALCITFLIYLVRRDKEQREKIDEANKRHIDFLENEMKKRD